ncbi:MAG: MoaD/ThiS family protein [Crocinitomicaceae bacterium]|nr:MoaD/ThiS family protein [Crocinitomicaceae bacterium]MBK8927020.1 MoaD/ThiS family protein [Crocinitomicaceae bacterium]
MNTTFLFFGMIAEAAGTDKFECSDSFITVHDAEQFVLKKYPAISSMNYRLALNEMMTSNATNLTLENNRIAFLPPFAGG